MADNYEVTGIRQETQLSDTDAGFRPVFKVGYKVTNGAAEGTTGHVIVPASQYDADTVHKTVSAIVDKHNKVKAL